MKKNQGYVILGILFVLVSAIAFAVPTAKTGTFWTAYVFTAAAFAAQVGVWKTAFGREKTLKSKFLGFPVVHIGVVYLVIQIVVFAVFVLVPNLPVWSAIVVCAAIAGISAVCMIAVSGGRGEIEEAEKKTREKVFAIKNLQTDIEILAKKETDETVKAALEQLAEKIRFSDPMSGEQLEELESRISSKAAELKTTADKEAVIRELDSLLDERNQKCKIYK